MGANALTCSGEDSCVEARYTCGDGCALTCEDGCHDMTLTAGTGATVSCRATLFTSPGGGVHRGQRVCSGLEYAGPGLASLNCTGTHACQGLVAPSLPDAAVHCASGKHCHEDWKVLSGSSEYGPAFIGDGVHIDDRVLCDGSSGGALLQ